MNSTEIKRLLASVGVTQSSIAKELFIPKELVYKVIHGIRSTRRVREAIANKIGLPYDEVWGNFSRDKGKEAEEDDKIYYPLSDLITQKKWDVSMATIYNRANKGKFDYPVEKIRKEKKKRLMVFISKKELEEIVNKDIKEKILLGLIRKKIKRAMVRIPERLEKELKAVWKVDEGNYKDYYRFIINEIGSGNYNQVWNFRIDWQERENLKERRIEIYEEDYREVLKIAKRYGFTLSSFIEITLEYYSDNRRKKLLGILDKEEMSNEGGR